jgi:hypothetical protein
MKKELFEKFLKSLGYSDARIKEITAMDEAAQAALDFTALAKEAQDGFRVLLENDEEFTGQIKGAAVGKLAGELERHIKQTFGLTAEECKGADGKPIPLRELVKKGYDKQIAAGGKGTEELQRELLEANAKIKKLEEEDLPAAKSSAENTRILIAKENAINKKVSAFAEKLRVPVETASFVVAAKLGELYDLDLDETGRSISKVRLKGKDIQPKSQDGTRLLTVDDIMANMLAESKFLKESNAPDDPNPGGSPIGKVSAEKKEKAMERNPHLQKAAAHLEDVKSSTTAAQ